MWEWDPPGELGESGAWRVVQELAQAMTRCCFVLQQACVQLLVVLKFSKHNRGVSSALSNTVRRARKKRGMPCQSGVGAGHDQVLACL